MTVDRRRFVAGIASALVLPSAPAFGQEAYGEPVEIARIDAPILIEGIAKFGERIFLSAVMGRAILVLSSDGGTGPLLNEPLLGVYGMAVDQRRRLLWAATATPPPAKGAAVETELLKVDPVRGRMLARYRPRADGAPHQLGDVAIGPDGAVFASDSLGGGIYRLPPRGDELQSFLPAGAMRSPQGMVVTRDRRLLVADYATGLKSVALASGRVTHILDMKGIDGLVADGPGVICIQNGGDRPRVVSVAFFPRTRTGATTGILPLAEGGDLVEPTLGVVSGKDLLFIGRSQWGDFDGNGRPKPGIGPTRIMRLAMPVRRHVRVA